VIEVYAEIITTPVGLDGIDGFDRFFHLDRVAFDLAESGDLQMRFPIAISTPFSPAWP